jgi:hypothetical protein
VALHALQPGESPGRRTHPDCSICTRTAAEIEEVGATLGLSLQEAIPSAELGHRVLSVGTAERGRMAVARGLTALAAGVKKCADNSSGQASKRWHEAAQGQVHKGTPEVEERSSWRWSPRRLGVHRNQDKFISLKGARPPTRPGPFAVHPSALTEPWVLRFGMIWTDGGGCHETAR